MFFTALSVLTTRCKLTLTNETWFQMMCFRLMCHRHMVSEEGRVWREGSCQPELLLHQHTEESLRQSFRVWCWPRDTCTQQNLPACRRRKIRHFVASSSRLPVTPHVFIQWCKEGSLRVEWRWNVTERQWKGSQVRCWRGLYAEQKPAAWCTS